MFKVFFNIFDLKSIKEKLISLNKYENIIKNIKEITHDKAKLKNKGINFIKIEKVQFAIKEDGMKQTKSFNKYEKLKKLSLKTLLSILIFKIVAMPKHNPMP